MIWGVSASVCVCVCVCVIHSKAIITFSSCSINYGVLLDKVGRCVGDGDIDKYYTNLFDNTSMKRVVALQDGYRTYLDAGKFVSGEHMSRVQY